MSADLCSRLRDKIPEIVSRWEWMIDRDPWTRLSLDDRLDHVDAFLKSLFDWTVCETLDTNTGVPFLDAAAAHGSQRRALGLSYDVIMEESALLRRAIWNSAHPFSDAIGGMVRIDAALGIGLMASLRGFARPELTASGEWEGTLGRLAEEWASALTPR